MRTIRQRKDDLLTQIKLKKSEPIKVDNSNLFDEYKKILTSNGIKNEDLIFAQLNRMIGLGLSKSAIYSNLKFINLLRSRLTEEGIPLVDAEKILTTLEFNMDEINEDDDYIGDVALEFAELAKLIWDAVPNSVKTPEKAKEAFNVINLQLPPA